MIFLYTLFIRLYQLGAGVAGLWNAKAKQWSLGRKNLLTDLQKVFPLSLPLIWVHSSSAGEFEQAKPVIEKLKHLYPNYKILVTFFSPSGYNIGKKWSGADYAFYLPVDTKGNARHFLELVQPKLVLFVKYDFWYFHLKAVKENNIPLLLISAIFRPSQSFFKWYGSFYLNILSFFNHLFVQDQSSVDLLQKHGINNCSIGGDTRFDRVATIAHHFSPVNYIKEFTDTSPVLVAGSTWPDDEKILAETFQQQKNVKLIIAPHEINPEHLKNIEALFPSSVRYSELKEIFSNAFANDDDNKREIEKKVTDAQVLIIDNIGMLSRLYHYGTISYIGGGFTKSGIHNSLEAAVYGKPVLFGPNYKKFREASGLLAAGGAFSYTTQKEFQNIVETLLNNLAAYKKASEEAFNYVQENKGATETIVGYIQEKRLLTN